MSFESFDPGAADFFVELGKHNDKSWFDEHREQWNSLVKAPLEQLLAEAADRYGPGRVTRINRDVRFSSNKAPYQTSASMWAGRVGAVYLSVSAAGLQVGGGLYEPSRDQLARARAVIDERPDAAAALHDALEDLTSAGYEIAGPSLTTAPRGYPRDHPRIELLRLRHYSALRHLPITATSEEVHASWQRVHPLNTWVSEWVGPAEAWP